jgi:hypothetical protein
MENSRFAIQIFLFSLFSLHFLFHGDTVTFITSGDNVEYWQYQYDLYSRAHRLTPLW